MNLESWFYRLESARVKLLVRGIRGFSAKSAGEMGNLPGLKRIASHKSEFGSPTSLLKTLATRYASPALPTPHGGRSPQTADFGFCWFPRDSSSHPRIVA
jgi:hypothetical protein